MSGTGSVNSIPSNSAGLVHVDTPAAVWNMYYVYYHVYHVYDVCCLT